MSDIILPDQFDSLLENNFDFSENDDFMDGIENQLDTSFMNNLIFDSTNVDAKAYSTLNDQLTREILNAFEKKENLHKSEKTSFIQCTHCDDVFTSESFKQHVCRYDENKMLIEEFIQANETDMQKAIRHSIELLDRNKNLLHKILYGTAAGQSRNDRAKQSNYECFVCNRKFVHESGLYRHYDKHIGEMIKESKPSEVLHVATLCVLCGEVFTMDQKVFKHLCENHLIVDGCSTLPLPSYEKERLAKKQKLNAKKAVIDLTEPAKVEQQPKLKAPTKDMIRMIYVRQLFHCEFCDALFANEKSLLNHISKHEPSSYFSCQTCDLKRLSFKDILIHRHQECWNLLDYRDSMKNIPCAFVCNVCEEQFCGIEQLILHRHQHFHFFPRMEHRTNQLLLVCELCMTTYDNATTLVSHLQEQHLKKPRAPVIPETSSRAQKSPNGVRKGGGHQTSTRPRQYLCEVCGKSYTQSSHLWQHLRFHQGVKPFVCPHDDCGRRFTIRPDLNDHIRKCHTGERPYLCTICGKRFLTGSVYYQHRLIHRGERRYGCDDCGKRFYRADALKNHQRIHTGERPYVCGIDGCTKAFRQRGDRDKHIRARHKNANPLLSPLKRKKVLSFGRGHTRNNSSLYNAKPVEEMTRFN